jgi:hypothetical protein
MLCYDMRNTVAAIEVLSAARVAVINPNPSDISAAHGSRFNAFLLAHDVRDYRLDCISL